MRYEMKSGAIFFLYLLCSCSTLKHFEQEKYTIKTDTTVRVDTVFIQDTLKIKETQTIQGTPVLIHDTTTITQMINGVWNTDTLWAHTRYAHAWAGVHNNTPFLGLRQDNIGFEVFQFNKTITILKEELKEKERLLTKRYLFYENPWFWSTLVLLILGAVIVFFTVRFRSR